MVECGGLENRCTERYRGFESLSLRRKGVSRAVARFALFHFSENQGCLISLGGGGFFFFFLNLFSFKRILVSIFFIFLLLVRTEVPWLVFFSCVRAIFIDNSAT